MNKRRPVVAAVAAAGVVVAIVVGLMRARHGADRDGIRLSGNVEATSAQVSFKIPGRVAQRVVSEGQVVTNGQIVARLDRTELEQELGMRRADGQAAQAALAELEAGARPEEIEQVAAALEMARAETRRIDADYARQKELFGQKVISVREFDSSRAASNVACARVREAEARLALVTKGPREETLRAARARVEQTQQAVALAETRLGHATLRSPLTGIVLAEGIETGEYVVPGTPVVTVGDLMNVWLRAYVSETDLGRIRVGQAVRITTDTYPGKTYEGRLSFIASFAEFTPRNVQTAKERVKLVYRVKVDVANPDQELKPGMPADAQIR